MREYDVIWGCGKKGKDTYITHPNMPPKKAPKKAAPKKAAPKKAAPKKTPKKTPKKAPMSASKLQQKAAGYMLAAANALARSGS